MSEVPLLTFAVLWEEVRRRRTTTPPEAKDQVRSILARCPRIQTIARAGHVRVFDESAIGIVCDELDAQEKRRVARRRRGSAPAPALRLFPQSTKETANV